MRIGFFTSIEGWGGSEMYLLSLLPGLRDRGVEPVLFGFPSARLYRETAAAGLECVSLAPVPSAPGPAERGVPSAVKPANRALGGNAAHRSRCVRRLRDAVPVGPRLLAGIGREAAQLARLFERRPVDLMQVNVHGYEIAGLSCRVKGIPVVAFYHTHPVRDDYGFRRWLIRHSIRSYRSVACPSRATLTAWMHLGGLPERRGRLIRYGILPGRFAPPVVRAVRDKSAPFRLISVGRLHPMKGFDVLIDAVALLNDPRITLDILGEGDDGPALQKRIQERGLADRVLLRGHENAPETYYWKSDCFVLASVSHESCGIVLPEAMAAGLPLITSDYGPLPEVNEDGVTGLVAPAHDAPALARAIRRLADDPELAFSLAANGARRVAGLFHRERMIDETLRWYADVLGGCGLSCRRR